MIQVSPAGRKYELLPLHHVVAEIAKTKYIRYISVLFQILYTCR